MSPSTLNQFPYIKNKLQELNNIIVPLDSITITQASNEYLSGTRPDFSTDDNSPVSTLSINNNYSVQALTELAKKAAISVSNAERTGKPADIAQAKQVIYQIPFSSWQEEFLFNLNLTEKSLALPDLVTQLEQELPPDDSSNFTLQRIAELTATYRRSYELLANYPAGDQKETLAKSLKELQQKISLLQQATDTEGLISRIEQLALNAAGDNKDNSTFINELSALKHKFTKAQQQVKSCINSLQKKDWEKRLAKVKQEQTNAYQRLLDMLNENAEQVNLQSFFKLLDIELYDRLVDKDCLCKEFLSTYSGHQFTSLKECKKAIQRLAGFIMVQTAKTKEQLDEGLIYIEHIPYINLGRDNRAIVAEAILTQKGNLQGYTSIESLLAEIDSYIANVQNQLGLINNATTPAEMAEALEIVLPQQFCKLDNNKKETVLNQYYQYKGKRPYRSLKKLAADFTEAMEKRLVQSGILEKISVAENKGQCTNTKSNGANIDNSTLGLRVLEEIPT